MSALSHHDFDPTIFTRQSTTAVVQLLVALVGYVTYRSVSAIFIYSFVISFIEHTLFVITRMDPLRFHATEFFFGNTIQVLLGALLAWLFMRAAGLPPDWCLWTAQRVPKPDVPLGFMTRLDLMMRRRVSLFLLQLPLFAYFFSGTFEVQLGVLAWSIVYFVSFTFAQTPRRRGAFALFAILYLSLLAAGMPFTPFTYFQLWIASAGLLIFLLVLLFVRV